MRQALVPERGLEAAVARKGGWRVARWLGIGVALLAVVSGIEFYFLAPKSRPAFATTKSIAVLPFDNLSDSKQNEDFSDALTSEVIYQLSKVPDIRVLARTSILHSNHATHPHHRPPNKILPDLN